MLANRLSEDPGARVLVLEAGRTDYLADVYIHMPAALSFPIGNRFYDWKYESEPEPFMNGRKIYHARGKVLGGSSSINGMIFQRGNPMDYERWSGDDGLENWDYAHCLPYFKKMETCLAGADEWRGGDGPLKLERGPATSPLFTAFFEAVQQARYQLTKDVNGYRQEGFAPFDRNIYRGHRLSAARAYYHPVRSRPNLELRTLTMVNRILFDGKKATGVEAVHRGKLERIEAKEVILCGGAINSPQLLQLSGVGNAQELQSVGVRPVHDLPGVGENLQDHLEVYVQYASKLPVSVAPAMKMRNRPMVGAKWLLFRSGPGATNHFEAGGFVRSNDDVLWPNLMFHFLPLAIRYDGTAPQGHGYQVHVGPTYADTRGSVKIRSTDPKTKPAIRFNYLSTPTDRKEWTEAVAVARKILTQPAFDPFNAGELSPGPGVSTEEEVLEWVARDAETALHPSCTCANMAGVKVMSRINNFGVMAELIGASVLVILLLVNATRGPGIVLHNCGLGAGHKWGYFGAFIIGGIMSAYVMYGFDTAGTLAEETNEPRRNAPPAIIRALFAASIIGGLMILFALMSAPHIHDANIPLLGLPYVIKQVLGNTAGNIFLIDSAIAISVCTLGVMASCIRLLFAMARDGRLPFGTHIARVSGHRKVPVIPALVVGILALLILVINIGNQSAFLALTSVAIVMFYIAYLGVTGGMLVRRLRGTWPKPDHGPYFSLGRWGIVVNVVAVVYGALVAINIAWPRAAVYDALAGTKDASAT